jgi:hypothetical protein
VTVVFTVRSTTSGHDAMVNRMPKPMSNRHIYMCKENARAHHLLRIWCKRAFHTQFYRWHTNVLYQ